MQRVLNDGRGFYSAAVLEASEMGTEGKGLAISQLLHLVVRSVLVQREDVKQFANDTQKRYKEIMEAVTRGNCRNSQSR